MATLSPAEKIVQCASGEVCPCSILLHCNGQLIGVFTRLTLTIDGECIQNIVHPAISVWAVSTMPNNDIVTGCSDGVVRVFSTAPDRWAAPEEVQAFEQDVASQSIPKQTIGNVNVAQLPNPDALSQPGIFYCFK